MADPVKVAIATRKTVESIDRRLARIEKELGISDAPKATDPISPEKAAQLAADLKGEPGHTRKAK